MMVMSLMRKDRAMVNAQVEKVERDTAEGSSLLVVVE